MHASAAPLETEVIPRVTITEVVDGSTFFVQIQGEDSKMDWITEQLKDPALTDDKPQGAVSGSHCQKVTRPSSIKLFLLLG